MASGENRRAEELLPELSIVIAVYNDWSALDSCLASIAEQDNNPHSEVVVIDDGSAEAAPANIQQWANRLPLTIVRKTHAGVAAARNQGIRESKGDTLLFVDADCRLDIHCLARLISAIAQSPQTDYFQLRLSGSRSTLVGRAEELRLLTFQEHALQPDGRIRYLNTAGFALRRARTDAVAGLFDPLAVRGEDTLLLADLMRRGELPVFVSNAIVQHDVSMSLLACLRKDIRSAYLEGRTYRRIAAKGVSIRITHRERLKLLRSGWKVAGQQSLGRSAWFVVVVRQALQRMVSFIYALAS
jgi:glycosyltransferase involved in cell wall biosynthesis